jgi:hypothetical protein
MAADNPLRAPHVDQPLPKLLEHRPVRHVGQPDPGFGIPYALAINRQKARKPDCPVLPFALVEAPVAKGAC